MKKSILYILPAVLLLGACTKDISSYNNQTKKAAVVPAAPLFTDGTLSLTNQLAANGGGNITLHIVGYMAQAIIEDNAQYNFQTAGMPNTQWNTLYEGCLNNLKRADSILSTTIPDATNSAATLANRRACVDITAVYAWYILVTSYGNIPYSQALNPDNLFPKYDDQQAIYMDLLKRLDNDLSKLSTGGSGFALSEDLWFGGNIPNWITFANSLKVVMGMTLADVDPTTAKSVVEAASPNAITSVAQNCIMKYGSQPSNNPMYANFVVAKRNDYVAPKTLMDQLLSNADPRLTSYYGKASSTGKYVGAVMGVQTTYSTVSGPSTKDSASNLPYVVLDYSEMEFLRAEAVARGYNVGGTVESHYDEGIRQSIKYWGGADSSVTRYLADPSVAYATAAGTDLQKIALQKWISLYNHPDHEWIDIRRLDWPALPAPVGAVSGFPNRLYYPQNEQTVNGTNYTQAASAIGGDKVETKLFWDKN
ncbi:MAG TPA: SusD/RagB family nutrient-binding outer membrane lipoprotein [Puia sp.]|uniref:SusD/RagB family nutrient-binding outer membrane lipoprotein n=1 Tax=Puia sp. TaxID=2045100 RepID=UPI002CF4939F|nr:SusD/RagB family nutrient-binding outer membrane lipoprotein [Puia sp.]HVU97643.1 SusD/RagB family nutrient-binding outer membrane lipoprotein [Puia sp.]